MCQPASYAGKNCATCAFASSKVNEQDCADCIAIEFETKKPYTKWKAKEEA